LNISDHLEAEFTNIVLWKDSEFTFLCVEVLSPDITAHTFALVSSHKCPALYGEIRELNPRGD
jgi:hypothetical protein